MEGAFAVWHPATGVVVRAGAEGWSAGGGGSVGESGGGGMGGCARALTALGFLSDAAAAESSWVHGGVHEGIHGGVRV